MLYSLYVMDTEKSRGKLQSPALSFRRGNKYNEKKHGGK
jgi:hypothetical protein